MSDNKNLILEFKKNATIAILIIAAFSLAVTIFFMFSIFDINSHIQTILYFDTAALFLALYTIYAIKYKKVHYSFWLFLNYLLWTLIIFLVKIFGINDYVLIWYPPLILSFMIIAEKKQAIFITITAVAFSLYATADLPTRNIFSIFMALFGSALFGYLIADNLYKFTQQNEQLKDYFYKLSIQDHLTKLPNRKHFFDEANKIISMAVRKGFPIALIMIDIDYFKRINDRYGHMKGDEVLTTFAQTLKRNIRAYDLAARIGGEEFVVLIVGEPPQNIERIAQRIRQNVKKCKVEPNITFTVSMGICCSNTEYKLKSLLANSDKAMYEAKQGGRDKIVIYKKC